MKSFRSDRWLSLLFVGVMGFVIAVLSFRDGQEISAGVIAVGFVALVWWSWPGRSGRHVSHAEAQAVAGSDDVIVYWRPGCPFCARLKLGLGKARHQVTWVNIWQDAEAAAFVASLRDGNETVPTVVTGAGEMLEPKPRAITAHLMA